MINYLSRSFFASAVVLLLLPACSTVPSHSPWSRELPIATSNIKQKKKTTPTCTKLYKTIEGCSAKAGHEELSELLSEIANCETGGKCVSIINSPRGRYKGPFQFAAATWRSQCKPIFARKHMMECMKKNKVYDSCCSTICAAEIISNGGIRNWPACGKKATS